MYDCPRPPPFLRGDPIARGSFGEIYSTPDPGIVVKVVRDVNIAVNEISIMRFLRHPHILPYIDFEYIEDHITRPCFEIKLPYINTTLEYILHTDVQLNEHRILHFAKQILSGLVYLHEEPRVIMHRDLKPNNILVDTCKNDHVWIADFGSSQTYRKHRTYTAPITVYSYAAPETILDIYRVSPGRAIYNPSIDLFSFGCILWEMIFGSSQKFMGDIESESKAIELHTRFHIDSRNIAVNLSRVHPNRSMAELLSKTLAWNPSRRFTAQQALSHIQSMEMHKDGRHKC